MSTPAALRLREKPIERIVLRAEGGEDDPLALGLAEPRDEPGTEQRGLAGSGFAEDEDAAPPALDATRVGALDQLANVIVAAEIDRRILLVEGEEAGIGRAAGWEVEAALPRQGDFGEPARETFEAARLIADEVQFLQVVADELVAVGCVDQREDRLAAGARLGELGKAPLRIEPVPGEDQDHRLGAVELVVELLFPALPRRDALVLVDVEEALLEALRL